MAWSGEAMVSAVGVILAIYAMHRDGKKDREKVAKALETHNLTIGMALKDSPLHSHGEAAKAEQTGETQPLTTDGLRISSIKINGS